ncbi:hypothetical protein PRIPAC_87624 [Pristionchus pacificus]|uniref:Uncharacterized protein n=1 Tax=Pristionchus pacificus TaxID=54126 RepID=A0A2A6B9U0_PRIPA|nr:hypothetical protein PRIPAC_87624 [Pristionchus pacificus]|eukprot:PDM62633.1 hypothetical protein PRIPAC_52075 [Pristionchus pacificus]
MSFASLDLKTAESKEREREKGRVENSCIITAKFQKAPRYVANASLFYLFIKAIPVLPDWKSISGVFIVIELLCTLLLMYAVRKEVRLLLLPYLVHQAVCILMHSVEISIWIIEFAYSLEIYEPIDISIMERTIVLGFVLEIIIEPNWIAKNEKLWVLLLLCVLSAALAVSIYFFSIIRNFYDFLKRSRGPILIGNQGVLYGSQLQPDRIAMIPHRL